MNCPERADLTAAATHCEGINIYATLFVYAAEGRARKKVCQLELYLYLIQRSLL